MAYKATKEIKEARKQEVKALLKEVEVGVQSLFEDEGEFKEYLKWQSRFHKYSYLNVLLIRSQKKDATRIAGYKTWQSMGRNVLKGEKSIRILAPYKFYKEEDKDEDGKVKPEKKDNFFIGYRSIPVFDVSQTDGDALPENPTQENISGTVFRYQDMVNAVETVSPKVIVFDDNLETASKEMIAIKSGLSEAETIRTMVRNVANAMLEDTKRDEAETVIQAESISCIVCGYFGIDTSDSSFGTIATWSEDKSVKELKRSLKIICDTADSIIEDMEMELASA